MNNSSEHKPDGVQLLKTLLALYADQEGVRITGEIQNGDKTVDFDTSDSPFKKHKKAEA